MPAESCEKDTPWPSGFDAWLPSVNSQVRVSAASPSGLAWSLYKCVASWRAVYGPSATERPLGTIPEVLQVSILRIIKRKMRIIKKKKKCEL